MRKREERSLRCFPRYGLPLSVICIGVVMVLLFYLIDKAKMKCVCSQTQHFDYPALLEEKHSDAHLRSMLDTWERYRPLVSILLWAVMMVITVLIIKMPIGFETQLELDYLLVIFPLHTILFVCFYIIGYKIPFYFVAIFWLGITNALLLASRLIQ